MIILATWHGGIVSVASCKATDHLSRIGNDTLGDQRGIFMERKLHTLNSN